MRRLHRIVFMGIVVSQAGLSPAWCKSKPEAQIADNFKVKWSSVTYHKIVSMQNPEGASNAQRPQPSENLSLNCEVGIVDPNLVLGVCRTVKVESITDGQGEEVPTTLARSPPGYTQYSPLHYRTRYVSPPKPPKWKTAVRSALRLPPKQSASRQLATELDPSRARIALDVGLTKGTDMKMATVKGHFYALIAESFKYVELPFEPNDSWVRLTHDQEVSIRDAWQRGSSYYLNTQTRPHKASFTGHLYPEGFLPEQMVVDRQLINQEGKRIDRYLGSMRLPFTVREDLSGGGSRVEGTIEKVRYKIAVNPAHQKIPFTLENIPLPKP